MVRKYNYVPPNQQPPPNMQYPATPQGPYEEDKTNTPEQWERYPQQDQQQAPPPYPPAYSPAPPQSARPASYGAPSGENQEYYRPPYQSGYPPNQNQQYPPPNQPYPAPNQQYPPPNQQYPPPNQQYPPQGYPPYNNASMYRAPQQPYPPQPYGYNQPPPPQMYPAPPLVDAPPYNSGTPPISYPYMPSYPSLNPTNIPPPPPQPQPSQAPQPPTQPPQTEEERGVLGAIAGGAAGGYAGHKLDHGFIGALGGAYAGHKLESAYKEHHQKPAPPPIPTATRPQAPSQTQAPPPQQTLGNFSYSSVNITLDKDYDLIASCGAINGEKKLSSISLNHCLTNEDGKFKWARDGNFGASARNVRLEEGGRVLEAELRACDGGWRRSRIVLDEQITNEDGDLKML